MFSIAAFVLWMALPILGWLFRGRLPFVAGNLWAIYITTVIAGALLYVSAVWLVGAELKHELYKFDLDGDRMFSDSEMTPEAEEAMKRFTSDTGRTFAPIVAAPVTLIWVSLWFGIFLSASWVIRRLRGGNNTQAESGPRD